MFGEIRNQQGEKIDYSYHQGKEGSDVLVVIGHGVTGNKDRPFVMTLADGLAEEGFATLRMSFTGNGDSEGTFQDCTITKEVEDLGSVLDVVAAGRQIVYAGHSMGGAVGVIATAKDNRISKLVSLAGMVHTAKFCEVEFGDQVPDEGCMWEDEECPLSSKYVNDMKEIGSILELGSKIKYHGYSYMEQRMMSCPLRKPMRSLITAARPSKRSSLKVQTTYSAPKMPVLPWFRLWLAGSRK